MKRVVVIGDMGWSIHRVHKGVENALASTYTFKFHEAHHFFLDRFMADFREADVCLTTMNFYRDMIRLFPNDVDRRKIAIVAHGISEDGGISSANPCGLFTYGVTSEVLVPHFTAKLGFPVHVTPNGVDPSVFPLHHRDGSIKVLGWCGYPNVAVKRIEMARAIAASVGLELRVAATVRREEMAAWYDSIDLLLVTSGPDVTAESGPLPPFEAIVAGVPVIGSPCGNFSFVPGPKFRTIEEGVARIKELQVNPERLRGIAQEQRACVMASWTYPALASSWRSLFETVCAKQTVTLRPTLVGASTGGIDAYLYINLEHRTDRRSHIESQLLNANIPTEKSHRIDAIKQADLGALGCTKSHIKALESTQAYSGWIAILEDDFTFRDPATFLSRITATLQSTHADVIMLAQGIEELDVSTTSTVGLVKVRFAKTSSGYIVHKSYIPTLLQNLRESAAHLEAVGRWKREYALDTYWRSLQQKDDWLAFQPSIGYQCESYSDVNGSVADYRC